MASSPAPDKSPSPSPSPWPGAESVSDVKIRGYLEANIDRYAPEALASALVAAGHDAGLVAAALE